MDQILHIGDAVVTDEVLRRRHAGQADVHICSRAVVTPTGWDYIRDHRLRVTRVEGMAPPSGTSGRPPAAGGRSAVGGHASAGRRPGDEIAEIRPVADDTSLIQPGRCEFPSRSFGCKTEEFGSGFVEPSTCQGCSQHRREQAPAASDGCCDGCNRHRTLQQQAATDGRGAAPDLEALVQQITEEIMSRLGSS